MQVRAQRPKCTVSRRRVQSAQRSRAARHRQKSIMQLPRPWRGQSKLTAQAIRAHVSKLLLTQSGLWVCPVLKPTTRDVGGATAIGPGRVETQKVEARRE